MHTIWHIYLQFILQDNSFDLAWGVIGASPGELISINFEQVLVIRSRATRLIETFFLLLMHIANSGVMLVPVNVVNSGPRL